VLFDAGLAALFAGVLDLLAGMTVISYTRFGAQICTPTRSDGIAWWHNFGNALQTGWAIIWDAVLAMWGAGRIARRPVIGGGAWFRRCCCRVCF